MKDKLIGSLIKFNPNPKKTAHLEGYVVSKIKVDKEIINYNGAHHIAVDNYIIKIKDSTEVYIIDPTQITEIL